MRTPSDAAIDAEVDALDAIHKVLDLPKNKRGLLVSQIAEQTGLAIGRVKDVLGKSELVLRRRKVHPNLWFNNWEELEPGYHIPRLRDARGRRPQLTTCPQCRHEFRP